MTDNLMLTSNGHYIGTDMSLYVFALFLPNIINQLGMTTYPESDDTYNDFVILGIQIFIANPATLPTVLVYISARLKAASYIILIYSRSAFGIYGSMRSVSFAMVISLDQWNCWFQCVLGLRISPIDKPWYRLGHGKSSYKLVYKYSSPCVHCLWPHLIDHVQNRENASRISTYLSCGAEDWPRRKRIYSSTSRITSSPLTGIFRMLLCKAQMK
ncbi:hypothetical protein BYT27DRAFT_7241215 [Phlegmacium glaucopus]|nr:hypothetical protein BYT27DRAFT_7241215 [Phlegmacium glaucopus]